MRLALTSAVFKVHVASECTAALDQLSTGAEPVKPSALFNNKEIVNLDDAHT